VPGTEEYADSEKFAYRKWDWDGPGHIKELIARVNEVRRSHRALQYDSTLRFAATDNREIMAYTKSDPADPEPASVLLMIVNLDAHHLQHGFVRIPTDWARAVQAAGPGAYRVRDLLDDAVYEWVGEWNYVRLEPGAKQGHILKLEHGV
jgi:starch synthase (maltosyl-transferring)